MITPDSDSSSTSKIRTSLRKSATCLGQKFNSNYLTDSHVNSRKNSVLNRRFYPLHNSRTCTSKNLTILTVGKYAVRTQTIIRSHDKTVMGVGQQTAPTRHMVSSDQTHRSGERTSCTNIHETDRRLKFTTKVKYNRRAS